MTPQLTQPTADIAFPTVRSDDQLLALAGAAERALVKTLAHAHEFRLPLATEVGQLAMEFSGKTAIRMQHLVGLLQSATPLPDALDLTPKLLPANAKLAIRLAHETGTLSQVYESLLDARGQEPVRGKYGGGTPASEFLRAWGGFLLCCLVLSFISIFILPTFFKMFEEFGMRVPPFTHSLVWLNEAFSVLLLLSLLVWLVVGVLQWKLSKELNPLWYKPWRWHQRFVPSQTALLPLLAIVVEAGRPVISGAATLARFHAVPSIRRQLIAANLRVESGEPVWQAFAAEKLLTTRESHALSTTQDGKVQAWLLRWLADRRFERQTIWRTALSRTISLLALLAMAIVVLWISVGVMICLFELVTGLT